MMWTREASVSILLVSRIRWRDAGIQRNSRALYTARGPLKNHRQPSRAMARAAAMVVI